MASTHCIPQTDEIINSLKELAQHATRFSDTLNAAVRKNDGQGNGGEVEAAAGPAAEAMPAEAAEAAEVPGAAGENEPYVMDPDKISAIPHNLTSVGGRSRKRRMHKRNKTHRKKARTIRKKNKRTHWRR